MRVVVDSTVRFRTAGSPPAFLAGLRSALTWDNPAFAKLERLGKWTGGTDREVTAYEETQGVVRIPRGALGMLQAMAARHRVPLLVDDRRVVLPPVQLAAAGVPRDYQRDAVAAMLACDDGVVCMPCGGGKTRTAAWALAALRQPALVVVHTMDLLEQWCEVASDVFGIPPKDIGRWSGKRAHAGDGRLVVATVQTLEKRPADELRDFGRRFGVYVADEVHHLPAVTHSYVASHIAARYRYGLTATPEREDGLEPLLYATIGPIRYRIGYGGLLRDGWLVRPEVRTIRTAFRYTWDQRDEEKKGELRRDWHTMATALVEDERRNRAIVDLVASEAAAGHCVLVLSGRVQHCFSLADSLVARGIRAAALTGNLPDGRAFPAARRRQVLADFREGRLDVVCSSTVADEGLDVPRIDRLVLSFPAKAEGRITQRIGRAMRLAPGKADAIVYDITDPLVEYIVDDGRKTVHVLRNQHTKRLRLYRALLDECGVDARQGLLELEAAA